MKTQQILENKKPYWPDWLYGRSLIEDCTGIGLLCLQCKTKQTYTFEM
jgi:hypothetical protein